VSSQIDELEVRSQVRVGERPGGFHVEAFCVFQARTTGPAAACGSTDTILDCVGLDRFKRSGLNVIALSTSGVEFLAARFEC
jgi:hypothetical protein